MRDEKKNEMDSRKAITDCPERVPGPWCKEEIQMKPGDIPDVRRNQFLGRTSQLEFPKEKKTAYRGAPRKCRVHIKTLAKIHQLMSVKKLHKVWKVLTSKLKGNNSQSLHRPKIVSISNTLCEKSHHWQGITESTQKGSTSIE